MALHNAKLLASATITATALLATLSIAGCRGLVESKLPAGAELFTPPTIYSRWWQLTEGCSEHTGNPAAVRWYRAPSATLTLEGRHVAGFWMSKGNRVVIADNQTNHGSTVRHEMLHALLRQAGHPRPEFLGTCASLVGCAADCVRDAGAWKAPTERIELPPESLSVSAGVELLPREADGQRWLTLSIRTTNPRDIAVLIAPADKRPTPETFGYYLIGPRGIYSGGEVATDSSVLFFLPREAKNWQFDFRVDTQVTDYTITRGKYIIAGYYAHNFSQFDTIEVSP